MTWEEPLVYGNSTAVKSGGPVFDESTSGEQGSLKTSREATSENLVIWDDKLVKAHSEPEHLVVASYFYTKRSQLFHPCMQLLVQNPDDHT